MYPLNETRKMFYNAVKENIDCPSDLRSALLKKHPNVENYLILLNKEITKVQDHGIKKRGRPYAKKYIEDVVRDMTNIFIKRLKFEAQKMYESDIARLERERKIQEQKDLDATVDGKSQGIYADMGIIVNDKTTGQGQETSKTK